MKHLLPKLIWICMTVSLAIVFYFGLDFAISDDTNSASRVSLHDFYNEKEIDTLFIGSSHAMFIVDANQLSNNLAESVFNLSSYSMNNKHSYYLLKEALRQKQIKSVWCEVSLSPLTEKEYHSVATYMLSDYMKSTDIKFEMINKTLKEEDVFNAWFRLRRHSAPFPSWIELKWIVREKLSAPYRNYLGDGRYLGRGFWKTNGSITFENEMAIDVDDIGLDNFSTSEIVNDEILYLLKIIDLCERRDVDLNFYILPYSVYYLICFEQYESVVEYIKDRIMKTGVAFYDFNLVKDKYLDLDADDFGDYDHIKTQAAYKLADFLEVLIRNPSDHYFYHNLTEKYPDQDKIRAIGYSKQHIGNGNDQDNIEVLISGLSFSRMQTTVAVSEMIYNTKLKRYEKGRTIPPINEAGNIFLVSQKNHMGENLFYLVEIFDISSGELLYKTITNFSDEKTTGINISTSSWEMKQMSG
ncbi:MAG: hypothetical protein IJJ92_01960 [Clostridia bacterium]|nr:hypothetical protein [Clostridia bacterium]